MKRMHEQRPRAFEVHHESLDAAEPKKQLPVHPYNPP